MSWMSFVLTDRGQFLIVLDMTTETKTIMKTFRRKLTRFETLVFRCCGHETEALAVLRCRDNLEEFIEFELERLAKKATEGGRGA